MDGYSFQDANTVTYIFSIGFVLIGFGFVGIDVLSLQRLLEVP